MDTVFILTVIGTVASLGGAGVSIWQASQSKKAAEEAKRVQAQLINQRKASELAQVQAICKKAQKSMEKYGPGSVPDSLTGVSPGKDAADVQDFLILLKEHRAHFGTKQHNQADEFCDTLTPLLDSFAQARSNESLRENGKLIVIHLGTFAAAIKKQIESKREKVF